MHWYLLKLDIDLHFQGPFVLPSVRPSPSVLPFIRLLPSVCPSIRQPFVRRSVRPSNHPSVFLRLSVLPTFRPSVHLKKTPCNIWYFLILWYWPTFSRSIHPFGVRPFVLPSVRLSVRPSIRSSVSPSVRQSEGNKGGQFSRPPITSSTYDITARSKWLSVRGDAYEATANLRLNWHYKVNVEPTSGLGNRYNNGVWLNLILI